jgi:hypothetical protein
VNKKIAFTVAYIVVALIAYLFFFNYNLAKYKEEYAILEAEWIARYPSLKGFGPEYFFSQSVYWRNVVALGCVLGLGSPIVFHIVFSLLDRKKKP